YHQNCLKVCKIERAFFPSTDLKCESCLLQWIYVAGNNWGMCENGTGTVGCGPQEQFRACADISIGYGAPSPPLRPVRPGTKTTPKTKMSEATRLPPGAADEPLPEGPKYIGALIAIVSLLLVLCCLAVVYLYHYHGQRIKHLMRWQRTKAPATTAHLTSVESAPIPPPRTKRQGHHGSEIDARESSILTGSNSPPPGARNGGPKLPKWQRNDGKCGICGDAYDTPEPRDNELGGKYGLGVIVRRYNPGSDFLIRIELTASHWGYFEFRLCPDPAGKQDCLDENLLEILSGSPAVLNVDDPSTRFYPRNGSRVYEIRARLPEGKLSHRKGEAPAK
uniref:Chitin-binding type-4 domain-containing protein n=1 Tax=Phlebotomus papatasi TaxID=29031 RepID=A0A1B0D6C3_PHLPP